MSAAPESTKAPAGSHQRKLTFSPVIAHRLATFFRIFAGALLFFLAAELLTWLEFVPSTYLPRASTVALRVVELLYDLPFLLNVAHTLGAWALGLFIATLITIPFGILIGTSVPAYRAIMPIVEFMRPIPSVALIPLAILLWGQSLTSKVILVAYATAWPILYNTIYGVHDVDPITTQTARCFGLNRLAILRRVTLPSAAPLMFTGIRVSASMGLIVIVGIELLAGANNGIGSYILFASSTGGHMDSVLASAAIAGLFGLIINVIFGVIERRAFAWRLLGVASR